MSKKISELISDVDLELLEAINIGDEEATSEVENLSLDLIKEKAMSGIKVISVNDDNQKNRKKRFKWRLLPLVAVLVAMGITVVAIESTGLLRNMFGESFPLIEEDVQVVKEQVSANGVTFTVEEAIIDSKAGLIVVSLERMDGLPFDEGSELKTLSVQTEHRGGLGWGNTISFSPDYKQMIYRIDLSGGRALYNQAITIRAEDIGYWESDYKKFITEVEGNWEVTFELDKNENVKRKNTHAKVEKEGVKITIKKVELSPLGVTIQGEYRNGLKMSLEGYLKMKDGSNIPMYSVGESGRLKLLFVEQFKIEQEGKLINPQEVESIVIEGVTIPMN